MYVSPAHYLAMPHTLPCNSSLPLAFRAIAIPHFDIHFTDHSAILQAFYLLFFLHMYDTPI